MNRQSFQNQLDALMRDTLNLGYVVVDTIGQALRAVVSNDQAEITRLIEHDREINRAVEKLHSQCLTLIACQQPMAGDLREIAVVLSLLPELERMADHAATCCKIGRRMHGSPNFVQLPQMVGCFPHAIPEMGSRVLLLLEHGLDALARRDAAYAVEVCREDDAIDHLYRRVFEDTIAVARTQPEYSDQAIHLLTLAHNLERIGDRVTNVAEQVIFLLRGEVVELNT